MSVKVKFENGKVDYVRRNLLYNGSLSDGNTVIVGKPNSGKTQYVCKCLMNGMFGDVEELFYIAPSETLTNDRKKKMYDMFENNEKKSFKLNIDTASNKTDLDSTLDKIKVYLNTKIDEVNNETDDVHDENINVESEGENPKITRLLLLDDMSTIADKSQSFANFYTRARKLGLSIVTIFHDINTSTGYWPVLNSCTNRFIFFQVGCIRNIATLLSKLHTDKLHTDGVRFNSRNNNWLIRAYNNEVRDVGDHLMIDTSTSDRYFNDSSNVGHVRINTSGLYDYKTNTYDFSKQYVLINKGKGNYMSYKSNRVKILNNDTDDSTLSRLDLINKNKYSNSIIYCITESLLDNGERSYKSSSLISFTDRYNKKRTTEDIDNNSFLQIPSKVKKLENSTLNSSEEETEEDDQEGGNIPLYLQRKWMYNNRQVR